ncbi:MAG: cytosine deaminase [Hyphomicrobiales bacterium]|nr:MAG: cytosine deaminase [Hyphomicrobiales bacterium]
MSVLPGFLTVPHTSRFALTRGRTPKALVSHLPEFDNAIDRSVFPPDDDLVCADFLIDGGNLVGVGLPGTFDGEIALLELDESIVLPAFTELHTHLDKGHIWPRQSNPDGTFAGALEATNKDRVANWSEQDVRARMEFGLSTAYAHGTRTIRTHLDSLDPQHKISWPLFAEIREEWADRMTLQGAALAGVDRLIDDDVFKDLMDTILPHGGIPGAATYMIPELQNVLTKMFRAAMDAGVDLDFHVDETLDADAKTLLVIAQTAIDLGFEGQITCGHCCSLSRQSPSDIDRALDLVARSGITVVSLPMCNMYLQNRNEPGSPPHTPRFRGVTLLHEMKARGIPVAISSDNTRDPFYAYGDLDALEVYREATRIAHLDHPIVDWINTITQTPAKTMGLKGGFDIDAPADLVLTRARSFSELLSRPQGDRVVIRNGKAIERVLPDYRTLDHLFTSRES